MSHPQQPSTPSTASKGKPSVRYRVTLLAICAVLGFLGSDDLWVVMNNRAPHRLVGRLDAAPNQHWLYIEGARLDLTEAINTTGTVDVQGLLAPLRLPGGGPVKVLVETRDARYIDAFKQYHFGPDTEAQKRSYLEQHRESLMPSVTLQGLRMRGLVARSNHSKLQEMAKQEGLNLAPDALILVEGERPSPWRGAFYLLMAAAGLIKAASLWRRKPNQP